MISPLEHEQLYEFNFNNNSNCFNPIPSVTSRNIFFLNIVSSAALRRCIFHLSITQPTLWQTGLTLGCGAIFSNSILICAMQVDYY